MHVPHETGRLYLVQMKPKGKPPGDEEVMVWEGRATNITDAFTQARTALAPTLAWTLFTYAVIKVTD